MNYYNKNTQVFLNGKFINANDAKTSLYSQTLHYGNGVFEGIRSYQTNDGATSVFKAEEHYKRLLYSAKAMHINLPYSVDEMVEHTYRLLELNNLKDAYIRPLVYLNEQMSLLTDAQPNLVIMAWSWDKYLGDKLLKVKLSPYQRPNPKSVNVAAKVCGHYTNSLLATADAKQSGYDEALLFDMNGFVAEGPGANFFMQKADQLFTPKTGNILPGITRNTVMELCNHLGICFVEKNISKEELFTADAAFFCGTAAEIAGIKQLNEYVFPLQWDKCFGSTLQKSYNELVHTKQLQNQLA